MIFSFSAELEDYCPAVLQSLPEGTACTFSNLLHNHTAATELCRLCSAAAKSVLLLCLIVEQSTTHRQLSSSVASWFILLEKPPLCLCFSYNLWLCDVIRSKGSKYKGFPSHLAVSSITQNNNNNNMQQCCCNRANWDAVAWLRTGTLTYRHLITWLKTQSENKAMRQHKGCRQVTEICAVSRGALV